MNDIALYSGRDVQFKAMQALDEIVSAQKNSAKTLVAQVNAAIDAFISRAILFIVAGFGLSVLLGIFLTRGIVKPCRLACVSPRRFQAAPLDHNLNIARGDETGILSRSLNQMVLNLKAKISEATLQEPGSGCRGRRPVWPSGRARLPS